ncbi:MAG: uracil-DNA glycosylase [Rhizobiales bacterium]|nr:uracil-DNA glycosylase [Hyphomicrobiales bacterium]
MAGHPASASDAPAELIAWYAEMGVDIALEDAAVDRLAAPSPATRQPEAATPPLARRPAAPPAPAPRPERGASGASLLSPAGPTPPTDDVAIAAREAARAARSLDELREALTRFEGCNLRLTATQLVFADGNPASKLMFVGEAPGRDEDIQGRPFVGRSGQLLDRALAAAGLAREDVYIANVVPWRPPGNRRPTPIETAICRPFVERQIELVDPDILVLLGGASASELLNTSEGILRLRGRWREYSTGARTIRAMATLHPAYLLRQPRDKRYVWRDLLAVRKALDEAAAARA